MPSISSKYFLRVTLWKVELLNLQLEIFLAGSAGSKRFVFLCAAIKKNVALTFNAELMSS